MVTNISAPAQLQPVLCSSAPGSCSKPLLAPTLSCSISWSRGDGGFWGSRSGETCRLAALTQLGPAWHSGSVLEFPEVPRDIAGALGSLRHRPGPYGARHCANPEHRESSHSSVAKVCQFFPRTHAAKRMPLMEGSSPAPAVRVPARSHDSPWALCSGTESPSTQASETQWLATACTVD